MVKTGILFGIDGGGTSTRALAVNADTGEVVANVETTSTNPYSIGLRPALGTLERLLRKLIRDARWRPGSPGAAALGLAGCDRPDDEAIFHGVVSRILIGAPILLTNDAHVALAAAHPEHWGMLLVAGTGSIAFGLSRDGRRGRAGGWGQLLGDEGSGYAIGLGGLRAVCRADDGRGEPTILTQKILSLLKVEETQGLLGWALGLENTKASVAALAPVVLNAWREGDSAATRVVEEAIGELTHCADALFGGLFAEESMRIPCGLSGGLLSDEAFAEALTNSIGERLPNTEVRRLTRPPVEGAVDLARALLLQSRP